MDPPKAESALREALAMGCDAAYLICDSLFAGSDNWANSYVLSSAIRLPKITRNGEHFVVKIDNDVIQATDVIIRYLADHHLLSRDR